MSYAGPAKKRDESSTPEDAASSRSGLPRRPVRPASVSRNGDSKWQQVAVFGTGLAVGIALGAVVALLTAPQAGEETRADLKRKARRTTRMFGRRSKNAWLDLRDETRQLSRRAAQRARRRELERESME